jgi:Xaa-Pro aminopeptidase
MIKQAELAQRRQHILKAIGKNNLAILPAAPVMRRNSDNDFPYRQHSDFYYLTGFTEPSAIIVLSPQRVAGEFLLFNQTQQAEASIWHGACAGQEGACQVYGAQQAWPFDDFADILPSLLANKEIIYYIFGIDHNCDQLILQTFTKLRGCANKNAFYPHSLRDLAPLLHKMRLVKSKAEIMLLRQAAQISALAHQRAMQICQPGRNESHLAAEINYCMQQQGARYQAYNAIVASGANSCILHYHANNKTINDGELVLIDAGAEYQYYAADISRTFPANGKFSPEQRQIYQLVLDTQLAVLAIIKPGLLWEQIQQTAVQHITAGLLALGLLEGELATLIADKAYLPFYMHNTSHWLGLDVHDVGGYYQQGCGQKSQQLKTGMVLTVEPGIYIRPDIPQVAQCWHNIGIRIEDMVLVTKTGCEVLSAAVPKTIVAIEQLMHRS